MKSKIGRLKSFRHPCTSDSGFQLFSVVDPFDDLAESCGPP